MNFENPNFDQILEQEKEIEPKKEEKNENQISPEHVQEAADNWLQSYALDLNNVYINYLNKTLSNTDIPLGTYNRVNGVVLFNLDGKIGALPDNGKVMDMIKNSKLSLDESVVVPQFNNIDMWGSEAERSQNSAFKEWLEINSKFRN
jgi:hypothetical protein